MAYKLRVHQSEFKRFAESSSFIGSLAWHGMGLGKANWVGSKILTPSGWALMGDIKVGDHVVGSDGKPTKVMGVYPQGKLEIFRVEFSDGSVCYCCDEHLWAVESVKDRYLETPKYRVKTLSEIRNDLFQRGTNNSKWFIPIVKPVAFKVSKPLEVDPYLMGVLISDGSLTAVGVRFTKLMSDSDIIKRVISKLPEGHALTSRASSSSWVHTISSKSDIRQNIINKYLKQVGLKVKSTERFIPIEYLTASIKDRKSLLQGLMDTDGYVSKDGCISQYSTSSKALALDFLELVQSLGGTAKCSVKNTTHADHYTLTVNLSFNPFSLPRKRDRFKVNAKYKPRRSFKSVKSIGELEAQCISVSASDRLYVTDDYIVTHNTCTVLDFLRDHFSRLKKLGVKAPKALVIMPKSAHSTWQAECNKFTPELSRSLILIPYSQMHKALNLCFYHDFRALILDESHYIKNPETNRSESLSKLLLSIESSPGKFEHGKIISLSGTPMLNGAHEWYTTWALLASKSLKDSAARIIDEKRYNKWKQTFAQRKENHWTKRDGTKKKGAEYEGVANEDQLSQLLAPIVHFRRVGDCVDLPDKQDIFVDLALDDDKLLKDADIEKPEAYMAVLERLARAKTPYFIEWIKDFLNNTNLQLVTFSMYKFPLIEAQEKFKDHMNLITGEESNFERKLALESFQQGRTRVLGLTYGAGSEALNLQNAYMGLYMGYPWTWGKLSQAMARIYRQGQSNKTFHYFLTSGENDRIVHGKVKAKAHDTYLVEDCLMKAEANNKPKSPLDIFI
jgi:SNF2 family DNA or RNA helicase